MEITYDRKEAEIRSMAVNSCQQEQHTQQGSCRIDWRNTEHRIILEYLKEHLKEEDDLSISPVFSLHSKNLGQSEHRAGAGSIIQFLRPHFQTHPTLLDVLPWRIVVGIPSCQNPSRSSIFCDNCGVAYSLHDNWYNCFIKLTLKDSIYRNIFHRYEFSHSELRFYVSHITPLSASSNVTACPGDVQIPSHSNGRGILVDWI